MTSQPGPRGERYPLEAIPLREAKADAHPLEQVNAAPRNRIEHRLYVGRRARDHAQDLGGRRLLLERFAKVAVARLELVEEAHVLDRDHCLVGEGLDELDLLRCERPHLRPVDRQSPDRNPFADERRGETRPDPLAHDGVLDVRVLARQVELVEVVYVQRLTVHDGPAASRTAPEQPGFADFQADGHRAIAGHAPHPVAFDLEERRVAGLAQPRSVPDDGVQDRLQVGRRARDHAEDLARRRLLLEGLFRLVEQPHVLDRDRRLVGEDLEQLDLLVGEGTDHHPPDPDRPDGAPLAQERRGKRASIPDLSCVRAAEREIRLVRGGEVMDVDRFPVDD